MNFGTLYGPELSREIGSVDGETAAATQQRFTTVRRKAAINAAQLEFLERTECVTKQITVALVDQQQEFDLEAAAADFHLLSKQGPSIAFTDAGGNVRWVEGDDLTFTTIEALNHEEPGWRAVAAGTPLKYYVRREGGQILLGLHPKPAIATGTASILVPYVVIVADLAADADEPFTVAADPVRSLRPYHRGLVHFAAADLEKLRKNWGQVEVQLQLAETYVQRFLGAQVPKTGQRVRFARDYRRGARHADRPLRFDRRVYP